MARTVTPWSATYCASWSGVADSVSSALAPARSGKTRSMPSPKVKASGAEQATTSSGRRRRMCRPKVLSIDSRSRWKCMVILGVPVLPEVGPSSATSSAEVATLANSPDLAAARTVRSRGPVPPNSTTVPAVPIA